jgi:hypothetical protein
MISTFEKGVVFLANQLNVDDSKNSNEEKQVEFETPRKSYKPLEQKARFYKNK